MEILAIIPARIGSKSIPEKNIKPFAGHPLMAYSIAAGLQSDLVNRVIVSTDDKRIAVIARAYGAEVLDMRPKVIAGDMTRDLPVFQYELARLDIIEDYHPTMVVHLRPTSPLRYPRLVDKAIELLQAHPEADSLRTIIPSAQSPYKTYILRRDYIYPLLAHEIPDAHNQPRQELPPTWFHAGVVDCIWTNTIMRKNSMSGDLIVPLEIERSFGADIDTPEHWAKAETAAEWLYIVRPA